MSGTTVKGPIPPHLIELMSAEDRKALGLANRAEATAAAEAESERQLQDQIGQFLRMRGIEYNVSRMDRKKTDKVGWPDFTLGVFVPGYPYAFAVAFEVKLPGKAPTAEQIVCISAMARTGWYVAVVHSLAEVKEHLDRIASKEHLEPLTAPPKNDESPRLPNPQLDRPV